MTGVATTLPTAEKRRRELVTPEGIILPITLASRGSRFAALVIDYLIMIIALVAIFAIGTLGFLGLGLPPPTPDWGGMNGPRVGIVMSSAA